MPRLQHREKSYETFRLEQSRQFTVRARFLPPGLSKPSRWRQRQDCVLSLCDDHMGSFLVVIVDNPQYSARFALITVHDFTPTAYGGRLTFARAQERSLRALSNQSSLLGQVMTPSPHATVPFPTTFPQISHHSYCVYRGDEALNQGAAAGAGVGDHAHPQHGGSGPRSAERVPS